MMSKKSTDLRIEKVYDVNDYLIDEYDYLKKLPATGSNTGIHCFEAFLFDGSRHFIKKCSKAYVRQSNIDNPWNEANALQIISHIKSQYFPAFINAVEDGQYICLISEYVDGVDLFESIQKKNGCGLAVDKAQRYLIQISQAVRQLHNNNLAHLDLSAENILIDKNDNIKLIDYGVCTQIVSHEIEEKKQNSNLTYTKHIRSRLLPGKDGYRAPEIEERKECDPRLVDAFSFGYIAWTMLCGNMPFENAHPQNKIYQRFMQYGAEKWMNLLSQSMNGWNNENIKTNKIKMPQNAIQMLDDLLEYNVYKRKSVQDLLNDNKSFLNHDFDEKKSQEKKINLDCMNEINIHPSFKTDTAYTHKQILQLSH